MTVPGASHHTYLDAMQWIARAIRTAGADTLDITSTTVGGVDDVVSAGTQVLWTATVEFPDGHTISGHAPMAVDRQHYAATIAACCDLLDQMALGALATHIRTTDFEWGTA